MRIKVLLEGRGLPVRWYIEAKNWKETLDKTTPDDHYALKRESDTDLHQNQGGQDYGTDLSRGSRRDVVP